MKSLTGSLNVTYGGITSNTDGNVTTPQALPAIPERRWVRNGKHPNGLFASILNESTNQAALYRTKEVFRSPGASVADPSAAGTQTGWQFAFHAGPYTRSIYAVVLMAPPSFASPATDTFVQLDLTPSVGSVTSETFHVGGTDNGWDSCVRIEKVMTVSPDTDYTGVFSRHPYSRIQAACLWELVSLSELAGGYLPQNLSGLSSVVSDYRKNAATIARNLWRRGAATVLNWTADPTSAFGPSFNGTTKTNVIDQTSHSPTNSTPGYFLQMTNHARRTQTSGVPVVMAAMGVNGDFLPNGRVYLVDSTGTPVVQMVDAWDPGETGWHRATGVIPAGFGKYDLMCADNGNGGGFQIQAVSIYEYDP